MKSRFLTAAALIAFALPALADFGIVSRSYEVSLVDITVPPSQSSNLAFKECADCDTISIRLARGARFLLNGRSVRFDSFRTAIRQIGNRNEASVSVRHDLESNTVTSVSVNFKPQ